VCRAKSDADFIDTLGGAIEEVDELTRIFVRWRETVRARITAKRQAGGHEPAKRGHAP
jgi:hypothetical protein